MDEAVIDGEKREARGESGEEEAEEGEGAGKSAGERAGEKDASTQSRSLGYVHVYFICYI